MSHSADVHAHASTGLKENDPAHDVDGKKLAWWLVGSAVFVFGTMYVLLLLFEEIIEHQRHKTVELAPTAARDELRAREALDLEGKSGSASIDDAIRAYVQKHGGK